jgi:hypothetical protein
MDNQTSPGEQTQTSSHESNPPAQKHIPPWVWMMLGFVVVLIAGTAYLFGMRQGNNKGNSTNSTATAKSQKVIEPTPVLPASWKTYQNREVERTISVPLYSVKYPSDTFVRFICPGEELTLEKREASQTEETIKMETCGRDSSYDIEVRSSSDSGERPETDKYYNVTTEIVKVSGVEAKKYTATLIGNPDGPFVSWYSSIYIPDGTWVHVLHYEKEEFTPIVNQMLATFTLLGKNSTPMKEISPTTVPLDKTYKDTEYNYSISYPAGWLFRRTYGKDIQKQAPTDILSGIDLHNNADSTANIATVVVNLLDAHGMTDIQEWITKYDLNYPKNGTKSTTTFQGKNSVKYVYSNNNDRAYEALYFISGNYAYRIYYDEIGTISDLTKSVVNSFIP